MQQNDSLVNGGQCRVISAAKRDHVLLSGFRIGLPPHECEVGLKDTNSEVIRAIWSGGSAFHHNPR